MEPLVKEIRLNAPASKIWKAITDSTQMKEWYFDMPDFRAEPGFTFAFDGGTEEHTYTHICVVTEVIPEQQLTYSWRYKGFDGNSFVRFELVEETNGTLVKLTHSGLETFPADNPDFARKNFEAGWNEIIGTSLKEYVETARIVLSIEINASPARTWAVITGKETLRRWAAAFGEGTWAETNWVQGSEVVWKDNEGNTGAKGIILVNEPGSLLKTGYYDDIRSAPPTPLGEYTEIFALAEKAGDTILSTDAGPLSLKHIKAHQPMWEDALKRIKKIAESNETI
ncbi:MAG: SRPBCC family protein [Chitinophagaceae bacterium]